LCLLLNARIDDEQGLLARGDGFGADPVDGPTARCGEQPRSRVGRYAVARPGPRRRLEGVCERVLGQVEPTELADEQSQQAAPLVAPDPVEVGRHLQVRS
jgi:hypothetical protein